MLSKLKTLAVVGLVSLPLVTQATPIFFDNFDEENGRVGALNYTGFTQWSVTGGGTVDLIGNGYFDFFPGHGLYVDLDGSTFKAGTMMSQTLELTAGSYVLSFDLGGSHREDGDNSVAVGVNVGVLTQVFTLGSSEALTTQQMAFTLAEDKTVTLSFYNQSPSDNRGAILDNVQLNCVPDGGTTVGLLGFAFVGIGALRRKLRK